MSGTSAPGPQRMQVAVGLVRLRERAQMTQEQVGAIAGVSKATVSRYEDWTNRARIRWPVVRDLCDACGAGTDERDELVALAKTPHEAGWWMGNDAVPSWFNPLVSMEQWATDEHVFANALVPGLLQTRDYALAVNRMLEVRHPAEDIERMVEARLRRQQVLFKERPLHLWAVLDEAVLARVVGDPSVMAAQMEHLCEMAGRPNIDVQVLRFDAGAHASVGHFVSLWGGEGSLRVVYIETLGGGLYLDKEAQTEPYSVAFDYLRSQAASPSVSATMLASARKGFQG